MDEVKFNITNKLKNLLLGSDISNPSFYDTISEILCTELKLTNFHISIANTYSSAFQLAYRSKEHTVLSQETIHKVVEFDSEQLTKYQPKIKYTKKELDKVIKNVDYPYSFYQATLIKSKGAVIGNIGLFISEQSEVDSNTNDILNEVSSFISIHHNQEKSEELLLLQTSRLNAIFESSSDLIWSVNKDLEVVSFNQNYFKAIFYKYQGGIVSEYDNKGNATELPFDKFWENKYKKVFKGKSLNFEIKLTHPDNTPTWKEIYLMPIFKTNGRIDEVSGIARDINDKKKTVDALHKEEVKFKQIFDSFQDLYVRIDLKHKITMVSPSVSYIMRYSPQEVIGQDIRDYFLYDVQPEGFVKNLLEKETLRNIEISLLGKQGQIIPSICNVRVIKDHNDNPVSIETVSRDITDLKQTNEALKSANQQLELSLKAKEQFLANMSHEIRTPMNGIIGLLDVMMVSQNNIDQNQYLTTIKQSSELLLNILNDILDLSKINAKKLKLHSRSLSISKLVEDTRLLFDVESIKKNIKISPELDENLPEFIENDKLRLQQILFNLISNAIKFTPENGHITIKVCQVDANTIKVNIIDTGIGIKKKNLDKLFREFSQISESYSKDFGGTGLGLAISMELAKLLGGKIGVNSEYGIGSDFWFTFKSKPTHIKPVLPEGNLVQPIDKAYNNKLSNKKALVVDDNITNRLVASEILKVYGCKVSEASKGSTAINLAKQNKYDVIFMDIQMPIMNGIEAMKIIKEANPKQFIVAMTAYGDNNASDKFIKMGFDRYLIKPITTSSIIEILNKSTGTKKEIKTISGYDYDYPSLEKLSQIIGRDTLKISLNEFEKELQAKMIHMKSAMKNNDYENISFIAHSIKGDASTLGLKKISGISAKIEEEIENQQYSTLHEDLKSLYLVVEKIPETIHNILNRFS